MKGSKGLGASWWTVSTTTSKRKRNTQRSAPRPAADEVQADPDRGGRSLPADLEPGGADVFIGGRFNNIYAEIAVPSAAVKRDDTLAFVDPIVGGRVFIPMTKTWFFGLRGDIGGFGIGNASDLALNGSAFFNWQITQPISMQFGYRALYMKYNEGENEWNATQHGPWVGLGFSF